MSLSNYHKEERPWGSFEQFTLNEESTVKVHSVKPNARLSLQRHKGRREYWKVLSGTGTASINGADIPLSPGSEVMIEVGDTHRLAGGPEGIEVLEIAFGTFDENDIERFEDDFGRL